MTAAVALSLATAITVRTWVNEARLGAVTKPIVAKATTKILVATHGLPSGQFLEPNDMAWQPWPDNSMNSNYIIEGNNHKIGDYAGSVVRAAISAGQPITDDRLIKKGDHGFLAAIMAPGMRAVTVRLEENSGLGGLVLPGDRVDVVLTAIVASNAPKQPPHRASETVLQNIRVLAIDQKMGDMSKANIMARSATLEVTPKQAEVLALVAQMGKLSLVLRALAGDPNHVATNRNGEPARPSVIWDNQATDLGLPPHITAASLAAKVELVRGDKSKSLDFPKENQ